MISPSLSTSTESTVQLYAYLRNQEAQTHFYRLAYSYVKNREDALDVVQNAAIRACEQIAGLRRPEALRSWFYRILIREALQYLRKRPPLEFRPDTAYADELSTPPENEAYPDSEYAEPFFHPVWQLMQQLPPPQRTILILRYFEGLSLQEIAEITQEKCSTVKSRLYHTLRQLRQQYQNFEEKTSW